jgi:phosphate starvation-inducible protein PhoH and related proteins
MKLQQHMKKSLVTMTIDNDLTLPSLFGDLDKNLRLIEDNYGVILNARGNRIQIEGEEKSVARVERLLKQLADMLAQGIITQKDEVNTAIQASTADPSAVLKDLFQETIPVSSRKRAVALKNEAQRKYVEAIRQYDVVFAIGPAGTGKTYLAVAMAISALVSKRVNRIILARPAVEAGERLGFLPGTLQEKVDPYLRPLYDALYEMLDPEKVDRFLEKNVIEIAPIAFMRGRTLNDSFVILDEAQNTTSEQMKMFVTRLGFNSKAVITGDITQIDLPNASRSGLIEAITVLKSVEGISFQFFDESDVVRHHLVQRIVHAYEEHKIWKEQQLSLQLDLGPEVRANGSGGTTMPGRRSLEGSVLESRSASE